LGACLSAFYLLPAIYEQKWINIGEAVSPGSRPLDNFLFIHTTDPDHDRFNRIISSVAIFEMAVIVVAALAAKTWRKTKLELWGILLGWAAACSVLMFPVSLLLWNALPKMQFMQFPWRWLLCLSMIFTLFVALGVRSWSRRVAVCLLSILIVVTAWHRVQPPWWDNAADLREMQDNIATGAGYEGTDEYTPSGAEPSAIDKDARKVTVAGPAHADIHVLRWNAESKAFTAEMSAPDQLALRLFPYPAWRVEVNGRLVETEAHEGTGQILVPVQAGMNRVEIRFVRTWDRLCGGVVSLITALCLAAWILFYRRNLRSTLGLKPEALKP